MDMMTMVTTIMTITVISTSHTFVTRYIFSLDHKTIAKQFLFTGMFWAVIGALMSLVFRYQLGFPEADMAWLRPFLRKMDC